MNTSYLVQDPKNEWDPNKLLEHRPYTQSWDSLHTHLSAQLFGIAKQLDAMQLSPFHAGVLALYAHGILMDAFFPLSQ